MEIFADSICGKATVFLERLALNVNFILLKIGKINMENKSNTITPTGINRLNAAIKNQQDFGKAEFNLSFSDAKKLVAEIQQELDWAKGLGPILDADDNIVPLATREMYDDKGEKLEVIAFRICTNPKLDSPVWSATCTHNGCGIKEVPWSGLHLHRPDSWERLEEDVKQFENEVCACSYYGKKRLDCDGCKSPCRPGANCRESVVGDVLRRAKALAS